jgi:hypothetical protein
MNDIKPSQISQMETLFLISGIWNCLHTITASIIILTLSIGTCGMGCAFFFLPVINMVAAIMDFIAYSKLKNLNSTGTYTTAQFASILDIFTILSGSIISVILGIVNLAKNISDENVRNFMKAKGIY